MGTLQELMGVAIGVLTLRFWLVVAQGSVSEPERPKPDFNVWEIARIDLDQRIRGASRICTVGQGGVTANPVN
jgi:hypothetical protein